MGSAHLLAQGKVVEADGLAWRPPATQNSLFGIFYRNEKKYSKTSNALKTYAETSLNIGHIVVCSIIYYLVIVVGAINGYIDLTSL